MLLTKTSTPDLPHSRNDFIRVWDNGAMDKYAFFNGDTSMGHYDSTTPGMSSAGKPSMRTAIRGMAETIPSLSFPPLGEPAPEA